VENLNHKQRSHLEEKLRELKDDIESQLQRNESSSAPVELDQTLVGRVSRVDALQQQGIALNSRRNLMLRQKKILAALQAMASGDYGYCQECDKQIGYARLTVKPEANLCLKCQEKQDQGTAST
jgi:DnaK suppressor protein